MAYTDRLKEARKEKGLSQADLAKILGIGTSTVSGYETGTRDPSMSALNQIMQALGVDANFIFQDEIAGNPSTGPVLSEEEQELLDGYHALNSANKNLLLRTMHYLIDSEELEIVLRKVREWDARHHDGDG